MAILVGAAAGRQADDVVDLKHELIRGQAAIFTPWLMPDFGINAPSLARYLRRTEAEAWIVLAGELLFPLFERFGDSLFRRHAPARQRC